MRTIERMTCRICGSKKLRHIYKFGDLKMSTFLKNQDDPTTKSPLTLVRCSECTLLQLKHTAPFNEMYTNHYWYKSGVNPVIEKDLKDIVNKVLKMVRNKDNKVFLDIGANDGTLLKYVPDSMLRIGVEPATNLIDELKTHCDSVIHGFWGEEGTLNKLKDLGTIKASIVTAIGMFYDSEDPNAFISHVKRFLADDGVFVAQMMTLWPMLKNADMGNVCHEHLEFYNYKSLVNLFERNGLEIFKVEENGINGGSYRLYARHFVKGSVKHKESPERYDKWLALLKSNREKTVDFVRKQVKAGKKVYVYGASTKAGSILQWYKLDRKTLAGAADRNPLKHGLYMVNGVRIVSEEEARKDADFFFVMPYGFRDHILKREKAWKKKGGKFIFCMPKFEVV